MHSSRPNRISATVGVGRAGVVDIEREARLGGPLHTKGVLILSGYLTGRYARNAPLSVSARVVFEQSFAEVDGDSASCTELYALLSALTGVPLCQDVAVTRALTQDGSVQTIGGATKKVEGFFDVCSVKGLTGKQGVHIPVSNIDALMLREDVVAAIRKGAFHVWAVDTVDHGFELLTSYPATELHRRVAERVDGMANSMAQFVSAHAPATDLTPEPDEQ